MVLNPGSSSDIRLQVTSGLIAREMAACADERAVPPSGRGRDISHHGPYRFREAESYPQIPPRRAARLTSAEIETPVGVDGGEKIGALKCAEGLGREQN